MSKPMPIAGFERMTAAEPGEIDWLAPTEDQPVGYFIEASINYPAELHEAHNDYPLAPEPLDVQVKMLSDNQVELRTLYKMSRSAQSTKLIPNLLPKYTYLVHYLNLRFSLEHGMQLIDVHRVLRFQQSRWLAPYIEKNSTFRAAAKNDFEKEFFNLMNNSI